MVDEPIVRVVRRYLQALNEHGIPVRYGIVFGSWARKSARPTSDVDVLVVSPVFDDQRRREDIALLWRVAARIDSRIEPIPVGEREFEKGEGGIIVEMARREGVRVPLVPEEEVDLTPL